MLLTLLIVDLVVDFATKKKIAMTEQNRFLIPICAQVGSCLKFLEDRNLQLKVLLQNFQLSDELKIKFIPLPTFPEENSNFPEKM